MMQIAKFTLFVSVLICGAAASDGDNIPEFISCLEVCRAELCHGITTALSFSDEYRRSKVLQILWPCEDDCKYQCVQKVSDMLINSKFPLVQFYGKWPFYRTFGFQEFFSMAFLVANLYTNACNYRFILRQYRECKSSVEGYDIMYLQYLVLIVVLVCGWGFSTIFHTRDTNITETLDYLGAFAIVCMNLNIIISRYFELFRPQNRLYRGMWHVLLVMGYCIHFILLAIDWNYGRNTVMNVIVGIVALVFWVLHSVNVNRCYKCALRRSRSPNLVSPFETKVFCNVKKIPIVGWYISARPDRIGYIPIFLNMILLMGLSLELIDFVPFYRLIDAHSLWHLVTLFVPLVWYDWNAWDLELLRESK